MSRYLRYLLIWISCTSVSVTAVILTVHFVVGSTKPTPLVARSAPTVFASSTSRPRSPSRTPEPGPTRSASSAPPSKTAPAEPSRSPTPRPTTSAPPATAGPGMGDGGSADCGQGGSGVHTVESAGGRATVRFGAEDVCLVSAVPNGGFTVRTEQSTPDTLRVHFSGDRRESVITATSSPEAKATVQEITW